MIFGLFRRWRRRRLAARPFPDAWRRILMENVRHYPLLDAAEQETIRTVVQIMVAEKNWEGCGGLEMTDEIRVTVAAQAGLLLLGVDRRYVFDNVISILVYPDAFVTDMYMETFGEAWPRGPVILSWRHVMQGGADPADGLNLVLHEFAHQIDGLDGEMEGTPPLVGGDRLHRWRDVATREYHRLVKRAERGKATLLNHYGASNEAEFFAVATEAFFERPRNLREEHPELYAMLRDTYGQDPAGPGAKAEPLDRSPEARRRRRNERKRRRRQRD
jgi:Mlc titration factor MtfA (ptsG expression regulator)